MSIFNENVSNVYLHNQMMRLMAFDFHGQHLITIRGFPRKHSSFLFRIIGYTNSAMLHYQLMIQESILDNNNPNGCYILLEFSQDKLIQIAY